MMKLINSTQEIAVEQIEELFRNSSYQILGQPNHVFESKTEEYVPLLTDTDLNNDGYAELKIIQTDEGDTILKKESLGDHLFLLFIKYFFQAIAMALELGNLYFSKTRKKWKEELQDSPYYINTKELEQELKALQMLFEVLPYQSLSQAQPIEPAPQKVLKKELPGYQQQGQ